MGYYAPGGGGGGGGGGVPTPNEYWVSSGAGASDSNPGSQSSPFATMGRAVTAAGAGPYVIHVGYGNFPVSATISVPSNSRITGVGYPGLVDNSNQPINQSTLRWTGAPGGTMISMSGVDFVEVDHLNLFDGGIANVTQILVESNNSPPTHNVHVHHFACLSTTLNGIGIDVCPSGNASSFQADRVWFEHGWANACGTGFRCQSQNAMDGGGLTDVTFNGCTTGMNIIGCGPMVIDSCIGAGGGTTFISITPTYVDNIAFRSCQAQGFTSDITISGGTGDLVTTHLFESCIFNDPVTIAQTVNILSQSSSFTAAVTIGATGSPFWLSLFDHFTLAPTISGGSLIQHSRSANSRYQIIASNSSAAVTQTFNPSPGNGAIELLGNAGSNPWQIITAGTGGLNPGGLLFRQANAGSDPIYLDATTLENSLHLTAAGVQVGVPGPALAATAGFPYMPATAGTPTGVPTAASGFVPFRYDTTNHKLWIYDGGWKGVVVA